MEWQTIAEPNGPYWEAYQDERERYDIPDDPPEVPIWFLADRARKRIAAARVGMEHQPMPEGERPENSDARHAERKRIWEALRTVEEYLRVVNAYGDPDGTKRAVIMGVLGAEEIETYQELNAARTGRS